MEGADGACAPCAPVVKNVAGKKRRHDGQACEAPGCDEFFSSSWYAQGRCCAKAGCKRFFGVAGVYQPKRAPKKGILKKVVPLADCTNKQMVQTASKPAAAASPLYFSTAFLLGLRSVSEPRFGVYGKSRRESSGGASAKALGSSAPTGGASAPRMSAARLNISLGAGWARQSLHQPPPDAGASCTRPCRFNSRCFDQRLSAATLCSQEEECCACRFCNAGPSSTWSTPSGVVLESLTTATRPPFQFVYNPLDQDMLYARQRLLVEPELSRLWTNATRECCAAPTRSGTVLDAGANFGWYSMLSLSLGCDVVAMEPVAAFQDVLRLATHLNGPRFASRLTVYGNAVYDLPGRYHMVVPAAGVARGNQNKDAVGVTHERRQTHSLSSHMRTMLGMAAMIGPKGASAVKDVSQLMPGTLTYTEPVDAVRLDALVPFAAATAAARHGAAYAPRPARDESAICMIKVDVEGLEPQALRSASRLLDAQLVRTVQLEVTRKRAQACDVQRALRDLLLYGFSLHRVRHTPPCWNEQCILRAARRDAAGADSKLLAPSIYAGRRAAASRRPRGDAWLAAKAHRVAREVFSSSDAFSWNLLARHQLTSAPRRLLLPSEADTHQPMQCEQLA